MIRVSVTEDEIAAHIAEARVRRVSKYPRCDCKGNKKLETKWKQDAKEDICGFIKGQYGKTPDKLDRTDKRALLRDCKKFIPKAKLTKLQSGGAGRKGSLFWAEFCGTATSDEMTIADTLKLLRRMYPKFENAKKLSDIKLTDVQKSRLRANVLLFAKFGDDAKEQLGLFKTGRGKMRQSLNPDMSLKEAEAEIIRVINKSKAAGKIGISPDTGYITGVSGSSRDIRVIWRRIASTYAPNLPQEFLQKYADKLMKNKPGKKKVLRGSQPDTTPKVSRKKRVKPSKPVKHTEPKVLVKKPTHDVQDDLTEKADIEQKQLNAAKPQKIISDKEALRMFINNTLKRSDPSYPLSMQMRDWSNPEWSLVDAYRSSISPELLEQYQENINRARQVLGIKSGGAYASIRDNRQLAVAHVITSWMCGDI